MRNIHLTAICVTALFFGACSDEGTNNNGSDGGGSGSQDAGGPSGPQKLGQVTLVEGHSTVGGNLNRTSSAVVSFYRISSVVDNCTRMTSGACTYSDCPTITASTDAGVTIDYLSGGTVTISGGALAGRITMMPTGTNYTPVSGTTGIFMSGDMIRFQVQGTSDVGAIDETLTAPSRIMVTAPALSPVNAVTVPRSANLSLTWTNVGTASGNVGFVFSNLGSPDSVVCNFAASAGSGNVPSSLLGMLATGSGSVTLSNNSTQSETAGGASVDLVVSSQTSGLITFQ